MIFANHFQNAYVTRDIDAAVERLTRHYGIDRFIHFDPDAMVQTPAGPRHLKARAALGWIDASLMIELVQPGPGTVDIYSEALPADDSLRFHHIAMRTADWAATRRAMDERGWPIAMELEMAEGLNFLYADARAELGHYVEYIWATPEMWAQMGGR